MLNHIDISPKVSIILPLYNKEKYVKNAIDSVLAQTVSDFELIIIDGKSIDGSLEIARSYADSRVHVYLQDGVGVSNARNQGVQIAKSNFIAFLDADDIWMSHFLETILHLRLQYPNAGIYSTAYLVSFGDRVKENICRYGDGSCEKTFSYFSAFVYTGFPIISTSAFATDKDIFNKVGGYSLYLRVGEDVDLYGKISLYYPMAYSSKISAQYNAGTENNTDVINYLLEVPLQSYLIKNVSNLALENVGNLAEYMNYWKIRTGGRNIYSGFKKEGRIQILSEKSSRYSLMKISFLLMSFVPFRLELIPSTLVRKLLGKMKLSI